jgi:hypothetical protein
MAGQVPRPNMYCTARSDSGDQRQGTTNVLRAIAKDMGFVALLILLELDRADRQPAAVSEGRVSRLKEKINNPKEQMQRLNQIGAQMQATPDHQV